MTWMKDYFRETGLHGFRHVVDTKKHWTERLFWILAIIFSWTLCVLLIKSSLIQAKEKPIAFLADTSYLQWNTLFPAVTVCETGNSFSPNNRRSSANEDAVFQEICFFTGQLKFVRHHCREEDHNCPTDNYHHLATEMRKNCTSLMKDCRWNLWRFDCCEYFVPLKTEFGVCYSLNTLQAEKKNIMEMNMNRSIGKGVLSFEVSTELSTIFIHSRDDIPNHVMEAGVSVVSSKGFKSELELSVTVTVSELQVKDASLEARSCRFHDEIPQQNHTYPIYSFTSCIISCRQDAFLKICGCIPHTQPFVEDIKTCDMTGLLCISRNYNELYVLSSEHTANLKKSLRCDCLPSCDNQLIGLIQETNFLSSDGNVSQMKIAVPFLPTEKFTRISVKGTLDIVVAIGSLAGLFLGASLLSVLEFVHFLVIRPLCHRLSIYQ